MKNCPYCKEQIIDESVRCRYCSSWLDSSHEIAGATSQTVVYIADQGLVRFAKFSLSILALFLVVGAFFYGFDLKQASKEIQEAKQQVERIKGETQEIKTELITERTEIEKLTQSITKRGEQASASYDEIVRHRNQSRVIMATIETPLDETRARLLFKELVIEHMSSSLTTDQLARFRKSLEPSPGGLSQIAKQSSFSLLRIHKAVTEANSLQPITVAILADRSSSSLQELRARFVKGKNLVEDNSENQSIRASGSDHTTAVASIVAAIAPNAKIIPVAVLGQSGAGFEETIAKGIEYAVENDARVIIMPFGSSYSGELAPIYKKHTGKNILFIASAGVRGSEEETYPAAFPNVLAIATTNDQDEKAPFSSYGGWVDLAAPGVNIQVLNEEGKLIRMSGGSFSTAITGGIATLVLGVRPELMAREITDILKQSSIELRDKNPSVGDLLGSGRIDAFEAVALAKKSFPKP